MVDVEQFGKMTTSSFLTTGKIFEIRRRLKHVKENDLAHGEFGKWLEDVEIHERQAQRLMKVATELSDSKTTTWSELPFRTLYEIATLPPEEREKEHVEFKRAQAHKFIVVADKIGENVSTSKHAGLEALYQIATLPESEREKEHEIPSTGEKKTVDVATTYRKNIRNREAVS